MSNGRSREHHPSAAALRLVESLKRTTRDPRVLDAIAAVPREQFVPVHLRGYAYEDHALPIGQGQTISQPTIVAMMTDALSLSGGERVLDVGTGSGYQAAVIAQIAGEVVTVEIVPELREGARRVMEELGIENVRVVAPGDTLGAPEHGPYDAILVAAAAPRVPAPLIKQLKPGGRLVIPVGEPDVQELLAVTRKPDGSTGVRRLGPCRFVPLVGEHGFAT